MGGGEAAREHRGPRGGPLADGGRDCRAASCLRASVSPLPAFPRPHSLPSCGDRERGSEHIRKERPELLEDRERRLEETLQEPLEPPVHGWKLAGSLFTIVVQWLSRVQLFATQWMAALQASLSFTISWGFLRLKRIELMMPSNHLTLCFPFILLASVLPSIRVSSSGLHIRGKEPRQSLRCPRAVPGSFCHRQVDRREEGEAGSLGHRVLATRPLCRSQGGRVGSIQLATSLPPSSSL